MSEKNNDDSGTNITLGKIIAYPVGGLLILSGIGSLFSSIVSGVLILLAGIIALPIVRGRLKQSQGISINRWATAFIVLVLIVAGGATLGPNAGQGSGDGGGGQAELISQSDDGLVPTIDQFDAGWRGGVEEGNTATYVNSESDETLRYNVTIYSSISEAESAMEEAKPERTATESVSIGEDGFMTVEGDSSYRIWVRTANGICFTGYNGGIGTLTPESNAKDLAEQCENKMTN